jgi:hypothetical protein
MWHPNSIEAAFSDDRTVHAPGITRRGQDRSQTGTAHMGGTEGPARPLILPAMGVCLVSDWHVSIGYRVRSLVLHLAGIVLLTGSRWSTEIPGWAATVARRSRTGLRMVVQDVPGTLRGGGMTGTSLGRSNTFPGCLDTPCWRPTGSGAHGRLGNICSWPFRVAFGPVTNG